MDTVEGGYAGREDRSDIGELKGQHGNGEAKRRGRDKRENHRIPYDLASVPVRSLGAEAEGVMPGVERRPVKTSVHKTNEAPEEISFDSPTTTPDPCGVKRKDPRHQNAVVPPFGNSPNPHQGDIIGVSDWL